MSASRTVIVSGTVAVQHFDLLIEAFELADFRIVAREDALGAGELDEQRRPASGCRRSIPCDSVCITR